LIRQKANSIRTGERVKNIERRIEEVEQKLGVGRQVEEHVIVWRMVRPDGTYRTLPEPVEEWLTYKQSLRNKADETRPIIFLSAEEELEARKEAGRTDLDLVGSILSRNQRTEVNEKY